MTWSSGEKLEGLKMGFVVMMIIDETLCTHQMHTITPRLDKNERILLYET